MNEHFTMDESSEELTAGNSPQPLSKTALIQSYGILVLITGLVIFLDQWTKSFIEGHLAFGETWMPLEWLAPYARFVHWKNSGAAFGMFQSGGPVFTVLALIVGGIIVYYYPRVPKSDWPLRIALGLQLGGALGNLIDRLMQGYVTDFISIGTFPVFNVADSSITIGVILLLAGVIYSERQEKRAAASVAEMPMEVEAGE